MPGILVSNIYEPGGEDVALLVRCGVVEYKGPPSRAVEEASRYGYSRLDLGGGYVVPGLIDAHMHLAGLARARYEYVDLRGADSISEIARRLRRRAEEPSTGSWILGRGWDQEMLAERRMPTRWDLDEAVPDKPVLIYRVCGHVAVANTYALRTTGLLDNPGAVEGVEVDQQGRPTGVLRERAVEFVASHIPTPDPEVLATYIAGVSRELASYGLTTIHTLSATGAETAAIQIARSRGGLVQRIRIYYDYGLVKDLERLGIRAGFGGHVKIMGFKALLDGSLGARTAALRKPYSDAPGCLGVLNYSREDILEMVRATSRLGLQGAFHAIGDAALELLLKASLEAGIRGSILRVEHASLTPPDLAEDLLEVKPIIVVQPSFISSDIWAVERLGDRARHLYAFKTLLGLGLTLAGSSDAPVEDPNPWKGMEDAVERRPPLGIISPRERLSPKEALSLYTSGGAAASREEGFLGCMDPGCAADMVVVDQDPLAAARLSEVRVLTTMIGGRIVYSSNPNLDG